MSLFWGSKSHGCYFSYDHVASSKPGKTAFSLELSIVTIVQITSNITFTVKA